MIGNILKKITATSAILLFSSNVFAAAATDIANTKNIIGDLNNVINPIVKRAMSLYESDGWRKHLSETEASRYREYVKLGPSDADVESANDFGVPNGTAGNPYFSSVRLDLANGNILILIRGGDAEAFKVGPFGPEAADGAHPIPDFMNGKAILLEPVVSAGNGRLTGYKCRTNITISESQGDLGEVSGDLSSLFQATGNEHLDGCRVDIDSADKEGSVRYYVRTVVSGFPGTDTSGNEHAFSGFDGTEYAGGGV